jgi:hypothetical protein
MLDIAVAAISVEGWNIGVEPPGQALPLRDLHAMGCRRHTALEFRER